MEDRIKIDLHEGVADVRVTRADKMNALDHAMFGALVATGEKLKTLKGVRAVVLSGEGRALLRRPGHAKFRRDGQRDAPGQLGEDCRIEHGQRAHARRCQPGSAGGDGLARDTGLGDRGRARRSLWRRIPALPRRGHAFRHPRCEAVGDGDQVGPDPRHGRNRADAGANARRRSARVDLLRAHLRRPGSLGARPSDAGLRRSARRSPCIQKRWPPKAPMRSARPSGSSPWLPRSINTRYCWPRPTSRRN